MRRLSLALVSTLVVIVTSPAWAQASSVKVSTTNAAVVAGLSITRTVDLNFGDMFSPAVPGTVVVTPAGALTASGVIAAGGTVSGASFNVNQTQGVPRFYVIIPSSITISNGTNTMVVDNFTTNVANPALCVTTGGAAPGPRGQCPKAPFVLNVGGTLNVGANQALGAYTGTFNVTVSLF